MKLSNKIMNSKRVLLIQPKHGVWDGVFIRFPESVLSIAGLPHQEGYDVTILDIRVEPNWKKKLKEYLRERPLCVGITSLTGPSLSYVKESINIIKNIDKEIPIVFGGVHATLLPEQSIKLNGIDVVVKGEGDYAFYDVIKAIENNESLDKIKGLYYKKNNEIIFTGEREMILDMDNLPETPYDLLNLDKYNAGNLGKGRAASFQTSRGCPFACKFCGNEILQKRRMRTMSVGKLVDKIKMLQSKYGYNSFVFVDDLTVAGISHFRELAAALRDIQPEIRWTSTGIRADLISKFNDDDVKLLWDSGCRALDIGIESGSDRIIDHIKKAESKEKMRISNKILAKYPFQVKYTFIIGYPTETDKERDETIDFYLELSKTNPNSYPMIFVYLPIVGTALYKELVVNGFKEPASIEDWVNMDSTSWFYKHENWIPNSKRSILETIMIASLFCSKNAKVKFTTPFSKIAFMFYHPIAKLRFKHKFFSLSIESFLMRNKK